VNVPRRRHSPSNRQRIIVREIWYFTCSAHQAGQKRPAVRSSNESLLTAGALRSPAWRRPRRRGRPPPCPAVVALAKVYRASPNTVAAYRGDLADFEPLPGQRRSRGHHGRPCPQVARANPQTSTIRLSALPLFMAIGLKGMVLAYRRLSSYSDRTVTSRAHGATGLPFSFSRPCPQTDALRGIHKEQWPSCAPRRHPLEPQSVKPLARLIFFPTHLANPR
jgi:hypothetical protein